MICIPISLVSALRDQAARQPALDVITFLTNGAGERGRLTLGELDRHARSIAAHLQPAMPRGSRVSLLYPAGLPFTAAFFGCLYAGVIPVPAPALRHRRHADRVLGTFADFDPACVLTSAEDVGALSERLAANRMAHLPCWATDTFEDRSADWQDPGVTRDDIAFLQYTSGSTSSPRGTVVTHHNLLENIAMLREAVRFDASSRMVSWLPHFHDMGLIAGILMPILTGARLIQMAPEHFVQKPLRWLDAISEFGGTAAFAPNFAYELCCDRIPEEERGGLDLSTWEVAVNAAETVRKETLDRFTAAFEPAGFRRTAWTPGYGLAEATLIVTADGRHRGPEVVALDPEALKTHRIADAADGAVPRHLVACGSPCPDIGIAIVNPDTGVTSPPDHVGEIWVMSSGVAQGYWGRPDESRATFEARLPDGTGPYLRTGDLGFLRAGQLYIVGRRKEVVVIRGFNHYPQDIEYTAGAAHPALAGMPGAAFAVETGGEERLAVVHEVVRTKVRSLDAAEVAAAVRSAVAEAHELDVYRLVLVRPCSVPRTSSGKIQRAQCQDALLSGGLNPIADLELGHMLTRPMADPADGPSLEGDGHAIGQFIADRIAKRLGAAPSAIDWSLPFAAMGLNSIAAVQLAGELAERLGREVSPALCYDYPTIDRLCRHLTGAAPRRVQPRRSTTQPPAEPIAIVGMACRFPGAPDVDAFWDLLAGGRDAIIETPPDRWDTQQLYDPNPATPGKVGTKWGGFLPDVDRFDPRFFGISPREAAHMDPQQRLLMEVSWEAFEDAGLPPASLAGTDTGVFVGIGSIDYMLLAAGSGAPPDAYVATGNTQSVAANRLSFFYDFHGPSVALDTACSASLVAIHEACESLRRGECSTALSGGVNLLLAPLSTVALSQARLMSPNGRCKAFDASANGYVRSEGCGLLVLRRLSDAQAAGQRILAIIRGSASNHGGRSNGLTAPNSAAQAAVIGAAHTQAGTVPRDIDFLEAHGTGTAVGDPIEFEGIRQTYLDRRPPDRPLAIGAVKSNIGHLEIAAGVAGVIKSVLALDRATIPPNLHLETPNPMLNIDTAPAVLPKSPQPWPRNSHPRLAGVSAFGFGGANAHAVLEEAPAPLEPVAEGHEGRGWQVLPLSAKSVPALEALAGRYADWIRGKAPLDLADLCYAAQTTREHMEARMAVSIDSDDTEALVGILADFATGTRAPAIAADPEGRLTTPARLVYLYSGQGAQYTGMAKPLYDAEPAFRAVLDRCFELFHPHFEVPLRDVMFDPAHAALLNQTAYTQAALFATEFALAALWGSWGVQPSMVLGHSVGEVAAVCAAGGLSLEDAVKLVATRGALMQALPAGGAMAAVFADQATTEALLAPCNGAAVIATYNGPALHVVSGDADAVETIEAAAREQGIRTQGLAVSHAFHSPRMAPMLGPFEDAIGSISFQPLRLPLISTYDGRVYEPGRTLDAVYWRNQVAAPVQFRGAMEAAAEAGGTMFLEIGPDNTLVKMGRRCIAEHPAAWAVSLERKRPHGTTLASAIGQLYVAHVPIDWQALHGGQRRRFVRLPHYPFQRERYWLPDGVATAARTDAMLHIPADPAWDDAIDNWFYSQTWEPTEFPESAADSGSWLILSDAEDFGIGAALGSMNCGVTHRHWPLAGGDGLAAWVKDQLAVPKVGTPFAGAVYVCTSEASCDSSNRMAALESRCGRALALVQAAIEHAAHGGLRRFPVRIITESCLGASAENSPLAAELAALAGFANTVALECPQLGMRHIDADAEADAALLARAVLDAGPESRLAIRGNSLYAGRLTRLDIPRAAGFRCEPDGAYLVTGAFGGLGMELVRWLVDVGARRLILTSRTALPPRREWNALDAGTEAARRVAFVHTLERAGASVFTTGVDLLDRDALHAWLAAYAEQHPPIRGVFHLAGHLDDRLLTDMPQESFQTVLAPKAYAAWNLLEALDGQPLDFAIFFSSAASLLGSVGQGNYAAANAILDALAADCRSRGVHALSINWGPWAEVGMAAQHGRGARLDRQGIAAIPPGHGIRALERLMAASTPAQAAVIDGNWGHIASSFGGAARLPFFGQVVGAPGGRQADTATRSLGRLTDAERPAALLDFVRTHIANVLGTSPEAISPELDVVALGLDSIMVADLVRTLSDLLEMPVHPREVFNQPDLHRLAQHLAQQLLASAAKTGSKPAAPVAIETARFTRIAEDADAAVRRNPTCVIILSAPRSGSTLLRAMLSAHPALFAPPELHLLEFADMAERRAYFGTDHHLDEGLLRALMELRGINLKGAMAVLEALESEQTATAEVLALLQTEAAPRTLVEKTPLNTFDPGIMARAERLFDGARYVYLHRHPLPVIESCVRTRMPWVLDIGEGNPYDVSEYVWTRCNENVRAFLEAIDPSRHCTLAFEDLVTNPEAALQAIAQMIGLSFDPAMLEPYANGRMLDGPLPGHAALGDPHFLKHSGIDPNLADRWRQISLPRPLGDDAKALARNLGYSTPPVGEFASNLDQLRVERI